MSQIDYQKIDRKLQKALQNENYMKIEGELLNSFFLYVLKLISSSSFLAENLVKLMDYDIITFYHSVRVGFLAFVLTKKFEIFSESLDTFVITGIFHDIGKIMIDKEILLKNGGLNDSERKKVEEHPRNGFKILSQYSQKVASIAVAHHEFQENAYPRKDVREPKSVISKMAYVISILDSSDALISKREYKSGISVKEATKILAEKYSYKEAVYVVEGLIEIL